MLNAVIVERIEPTDQLLILKALPDEGVSDFLPGQYCTLGLPDENERRGVLKRSYSICSSPEQKEFLEFYIAIVPDGQLTGRLAACQVGDRVEAGKKIVGRFTLEGVPEEKNLILVSTGTGVAPYISMLRTSSFWNREGSTTLIQGVRHPEHLVYGPELEQFAEKYSNFRFVPIVSREASGWKGERGRVQNLFDQKIVPVDPEKDHVFLCGNPAMVDDVEERLLKQGFTLHSPRNPGTLHLEKYW